MDDKPIKKSSWWERKWHNKYCAITLCRLRPGVNKYNVPYCIKLKCGHAFYRNAFNSWIMHCENEIPTCPSCRVKINIEDLS